MTRVAVRLAELEYLDAVRHEADETLQNLVDEVRGVFDVELCMVNLALADALYFRAWSGELPPDAAEARRTSFEDEMCGYALRTGAPLVVHDLLATEEFEDHDLFVLRGIRFYAGTPLVTSRGVHIGTLCLMDARPREFDEGQMTLLGAFARAVVERLELIGALRREQAAREEEEQQSRELRYVLDASPDIIATIDSDGVFKSINPACRAILGYEPGELVGRSYMDVVHPDDRSAGIPASLVGGNPPSGFENRYLRKDGGIVWIEWSATPVPEEGIIYCVARDVTRRKRAERHLARSERRFRQLFEQSVDALLVHDQTGQMVDCNLEACRSLGYTREELLELSIKDFATDLVSEEARQRGGTLWQRVSAGEPGEVTGFHYGEHRRKNGTTFPVEVNVGRIDYGGEPMIFAAVHDITERRRMEAELRESEERYRTLVEHHPDAIVVHSEGRIVYVNAAGVDLLGATGPEDLLGEPVLDVIHPDYRDLARERVRRVQEEGSVAELVEEKIITIDGRVIDAELVGLPLTYGGRPAVQVVVRDITERKRAEEVLVRQARHAALRVDVSAALAGSGDLGSILWRCMESMVQNLGAAFARIWTLDEEESVLKLQASSGMYTHLDGPHGKVRVGEFKIGRIGQERVAHLTNDVVNDPRISDPEWAKREGMVAFAGYPMIVEDRLVGVMAMFAREPLAEDTIEALASVADVIAQGIERKKSEKALSNSEERYKALYEDNPSMYFTLDVEGTVLSVNHFGAEQLGYAPEELVGRPVLDIFHEEDKEDVSRYFRACLRNPEQTWDWEARKVRKDGSKVWVWENARVVRSPDGSTVVLIVCDDITERKRSEEALRESEVRHRAVVDTAFDPIVTMTADGLVRSFNRAAEGIFGYAAAEVVGRGLELLMPERFREPHRAGMRRYLETGEARVIGRRRVEFAGRRKDGEEFPLELSLSEMREGKDVLFVGAIRDITERKRAEAMSEGQARVLEMITTDAPLRVVLEALTRLIEEHSREMLCSILLLDENGINLRFGAGPSLPDGYNRAIDGVAVGPSVGSCGTAAYRKEAVIVSDIAGDPLWAEYRDLALEHGLRACWSTPILATGGSVLGTFAMYYREPRSPSPRDFQLIEVATRIAGIAIERKALEEQLTYQAFHDPLTDLPNRALLMDRLRQALARVDRRKKSSVALLFLDLDNFKVVNDSLGHEAGDRLLVAVTERLEACLRPGDTAARLGGDEFTILLDEIMDESEATSVAERIAEELRAPFVLGDYEVTITASIGVVLRGSSTGYQPEDLLRNADMAMYEAKSKGKDRHRVFTQSMHVRAVARLRLETELRRAIERGEFRLYYQPTLRLVTDLQQRLRSKGSLAIVASPDTDRPLIAGMEALLRWEHPERGLVSPLEFIPLAEETGLIVPIGRWVIREACRQAREWQERYPNNPPLVMSVNLSAYQFQDPDLAQDIVQALEVTGLDPGSLILEITESVLMKKVQPTIGALEELRRVGVQISIDDFGTGYSSLSYLKRFPVDYLKIDRSFIDGLEDHPENAVLVSGIVVLGHALGLQVVAEGVETAGQLARVREMGCDLAQGFFFSRPLPGEAADALLESRQ